MEGGRWETRVTGAQGGELLSLGASQVSSADVTVKAETLRAAGTRASTSAQPAVAVGVRCSEPQLCPQEGVDFVSGEARVLATMGAPSIEPGI